MSHYYLPLPAMQQ